MRLIHFFDRSSELTPDHIFVRQEEVNRSYAQFVASSHRIAAALLRDWMELGLRVGVYMPNDWRGLQAIFGLFRAGCVMVPVKARDPIAQNAKILKNTGAQAMFYHSAYTADVAQLRVICPNLKFAICSYDQTAPALTEWMVPEGRLHLTSRMIQRVYEFYMQHLASLAIPKGSGIRI